MKKILLSIVALLTINVSIAQQKVAQSNLIYDIKHVESVATTPSSSSSVAPAPAPFWTNDFSNSSDWTMVDLINGGLQNWVITTNGPTGSFSQPMEVIASTTAQNGFALFDSDALNTQYTPQEATLTYNGTVDCSQYQYVNINFECYHRVFRDSLFLETSLDNFATVAGRYPIQENLGVGNSSPNPEYISVNVSASSGNQSAVYFRFHYEGEWDYATMIDDVNFSETPDNELSFSDETFGGWWLGYQVTGDLGTDFTMYPMSQAIANPYRLEGVVRNSGVQTQNNVTMHVDVVDENGSTTALTSSSVSLTTGETDTLATTSTFLPPNMGLYNMSFWATSDSFPTTDTLTRSTIVTDTVYGMDYDWNFDGANASGYAYLSRPSCGQVLANAFDIYANATLTSISFHVSDQSVAGGDVTVQLYETDGQIFLEESDSYTLQQSDIGNWVTIPLLSPYPLFAGTSYLAGVLGTQHPTDTVGVSSSGNDHTSGYIQDNGCDIGTSGFGAWYTSDARLIRMNFGTVSAVNDILLNSGFIVYPNPSNGIFTIDNQNNETYSVSVTDIIGKVVYNSIITNLTNKSIDLSKVESGVYSIEFENDGNSFVQKIIIE